MTLATPVNSQNDRVYSDARKKKQVPAKRLVREREHFSGGIMVSVGVSRMGKTSVMFVESGAKVNSEYYCDHVSIQGLLPDIRAICNRQSWTLQQDVEEWQKFSQRFINRSIDQWRRRLQKTVENRGRHIEFDF